MKPTLLLFFVALIVACQPKPTENKGKETEQKASEQVQENLSEYPELLAQAVTAHGGLKTWKSYGTLSYNKVGANGSKEKHLINLYNRKVLIDRDTVKLGFDGQQVWVTPNLASFGKGSARFYHNLYFYFFGIPFLLTDPGINYEDLGTKTINDQKYRALKVTYNEGVGDSDEDIYIAHFNPETYKLELLLYTVTYYSGEKTENYNALAYTEWQEVDGLLVPKKLVGYVFENDSLGNQRYVAHFEDVNFESKIPNEEVFEMPENAEVDSLKSE